MEFDKMEFDIRSLFVEFKDMMLAIQPVLQFIDANGGFNYETGDFSGFYALERAQIAGTLPKDVEDALDTFGHFMAGYIIGSKMIISSSFAPHSISNIQH